jgi:hypothetical protein
VISVFLAAKTLLMDRTLLRISDGISDQKQGTYHECMQLEHKAEPSHDKGCSEQLLAKELMLELMLSLIFRRANEYHIEFG